MNSNVKITLKPGRESSVLRHHPWIFSGAVKNLEGNPVDGQTVDVYSSSHQWLTRGSYSSKSQIRVRNLSYKEDDEINRQFFRDRISSAIEMRKVMQGFNESNAFRLIYSESDGLPGVIVDRYDEFLVCQFLSAGAEYWKEDIVSLLAELWPSKGIYERSDTDSRRKEGLPGTVGLLYGSDPPGSITVREGKLQFNVDIFQGHKTGFYIDQRVNREIAMKYSHGKEVLNAFSYTGGFGIAAAMGGCKKVVNIDTSQEALDLARENFVLNGLSLDNAEFIREDVFNLLRKYRDSRMQFDMIVLDPPKFVASAGQLAGGSRGYKDINLLAFKLLRPGGILVTFSCSGYVKPDLFQKIVADAALDAGVSAKIEEFLFQAPDHPVYLNFPEALYLKGLICKTG